MNRSKEHETRGPKDNETAGALGDKKAMEACVIVDNKNRQNTKRLIVNSCLS